MSLTFKTCYILKADFYSAFKALCNLPVKNPKDVLNLATASRRMRDGVLAYEEKAKERNEFVQDRFKVHGDLDEAGCPNCKRKAGTYVAEGEKRKLLDAEIKVAGDALKAFLETEVDTALPGKVKLDKDTFAKLTCEQIGLLLDVIEPPDEAK